MQNAGVAQLVEQLTCNQQVGGSNPFASSVANIWADAGVGEPGRTVNPLAYALEGSNPPPPTGSFLATRAERKIVVACKRVFLEDEGPYRENHACKGGYTTRE